MILNHVVHKVRSPAIAHLAHLWQAHLDRWWLIRFARPSVERPHAPTGPARTVSMYQARTLRKRDVLGCFLSYSCWRANPWIFIQ